MKYLCVIFLCAFTLIAKAAVDEQACQANAVAAVQQETGITGTAGTVLDNENRVDVYVNVPGCSQAAYRVIFYNAFCTQLGGVASTGNCK